MAVDEFGREIPAPAAQAQPRGAPHPGASSSYQPYHPSHHGVHERHPAPQHHHYHASSRRYDQHHQHRPMASPPGAASPRQPHLSGRYQFASQVYAPEPLLCQVVWSDERDAKAQQSEPAPNDAEAAPGPSDEKRENDAPESTPGDAAAALDGTDAEYQAYKRQYCLRYVRSVLNHHLDDSWFRDLVSPLQRHRSAVRNQQRAAREADALRRQCRALLGPESEGGGGSGPLERFDDAVSLSHGRKAQKGNGDKGRPSNPVPDLHVLSLLDTSLIVQDLPHFVTDEQVQAAFMAATSAPASAGGANDAAAAPPQAAVPVVYSGTTLPEASYLRSVLVVWNTPEERQEVWRQLLQQQSQNGSGGTTYLSSASASVPRRMNHSAYEPGPPAPQAAVASLAIDATDPYGRRDIDANGRGGAPPEAAGPPPPPRTLQARVVLPHSRAQQKIVVLSAGLSTTARVPTDLASVRTMAAALDAKWHIPAELRLNGLLAELEQTLQPLVGGGGDGGSDSSAQVTSLLLDTSLAYLRRVHLVSFYHGLLQQNIMTDGTNVADVVLSGGSGDASGSHRHGNSHHKSFGKGSAAPPSASTVYLRLENADELLAETADAATAAETAIETDGAVAGQKRVRNQEEDDNDDEKRENDKDEADVGASDAKITDPESGVIDENINVNQKKDINEPQSPTSKADKPVVRDLLVQRLDDGIAKALQDCAVFMQSFSTNGSVVVSEQVDKDARAIEQAEQAAVDRWIQDHSILDADGRARCSFHFCHKLFKGDTFLTKHLLKKHGEFLKAEQAKCHDDSMMQAWDDYEDRPVPDVLVDCGKQFGLVPAKVFGRVPDCADPEPRLWQREQEKRQRDEEQRLRREREREQRKLQQSRLPQSEGPRGGGFVDVDDMKDEKLEVSFENVEVPIVVTKKKKKRKLL